MPQKGNKGDTKMLNTHTLPFNIIEAFTSYCLMSGYIFECI
ncbi:hypothetical protein BANRA_05326 [Escherichia coli]|nr:hypothetical protein BANRA_05326 [Escherichia coli]